MSRAKIVAKRVILSVVLFAACAVTAGDRQAGFIRVFSGLAPDETRLGLPNPERGWRFEIGVGRLPEDPCKFSYIADLWPFPRFKADGVTVSQAYCYLSQFHDRPISDEKIAALEADFARARKEGVKFLLRFAYDCVPGQRQTPDLARILAHIAQLKPVVRRNVDVLYCLQVGWLGAWGEFHSSARGLEKDPSAVAAIMTATLDMLPPERMTMMRRVDYKINALRALGQPTNEVTAATAWTAAPAARIGFFNDATLANWWDGATFVDEPYAEDSNREYDRVKREGLYTPVDGELFWTGPESRPSFACGIRAIDRFSKQHYTTFSLVHGNSQLDRKADPWTIDGWKVTPVTPDELTFFGIDFDPSYFQDVPYRTAYEFIRDHLGYRLALREAELPAADGKEGMVRLVLHNYGFAAPVNPREIVLVAIAADGGVRECPTGFDCRRLLPGRDETLEVPFVRQSGERLALWLPDQQPSLRNRSEYAVRLATRIPVETVGGRLLHILDGLHEPVPEVLTEFVKSESHPRNSEGDVVKLKDGRLLVVYSHFYKDATSQYAGGAHDHSSAELVVTASSDGGKTWSPIRTVVRKPEGSLNVMSASFLRLGDGRLALFYLLKQTETVCVPTMVVSSDEGETWSAPTCCVPDSALAYYVMNNARAVRLANGRLILPLAHHDIRRTQEGKFKETQPSHVLCAFSDDGGKTWRMSADRRAAKPEKEVYLQEPGLIELKDGRLMMYARSNQRRQWRLYSTDGGDHWSEPEPITEYATTTVSPVTYTRLSTGQLALVFNDASLHPKDEEVVVYERRWPYSIAVSSDEGRTWKKKVLEPDSPQWNHLLNCCYCAMREIDGRLILVYCHRDWLATTRVMSVPLEWLPR